MIIESIMAYELDEEYCITCILRSIYVYLLYYPINIEPISNTCYSIPID